jgi:hypothetical protein
MSSGFKFEDLPPETQRIIQLERIFSPHTRKKRDDLLDKNRDYDRFVHYTSAEAALNIIRSRRIWMRNTTCMVDFREVQHGFQILNTFFSTNSNIDAFNSALDKCAPGAAQEAINMFYQRAQIIQYNTYITSISEHDDKEDLHGRLSMWRAFGGSTTTRVAVVLRIPKFSQASTKLSLIFSPVSYFSEKEGHEVIFATIKNIQDNCEFLRSIERENIVRQVFSMLLSYVTCLKHEGFSEEREWRSIYSPQIWLSPLMESSIEVLGGIPQLIYKVPLDQNVSPDLADLDFTRLFDRLIIGPSPYSLAMGEAFILELSKAGIVDAGNRVYPSCIPIRV